MQIWEVAPKEKCVGGGDRTHDPRLMSPVLYRLSYPDNNYKITCERKKRKKIVAGLGFEPRPSGYEPDELPLLNPAMKYHDTPRKPNRQECR